MITLLGVLGVCGALMWVRRTRGHRRTKTRGRRRAPLLMTIAVVVLHTVVAAPPAVAQSCEEPNPERPGAGMVGAIDPPVGHGEAGSAYENHSYAGLVWYVDDCDDDPLSVDPSTTIDTWIGNQLFNVGKNIVGATNSLHYTVLEGGLLNPLYDAVSSGADKVYNNIYTQLFGLAALLLAIMLFRNIWRGDLSTVSKRALFALAGMWLAASSLALLRYYDDIDNAIVETTTNIQAGFVDDAEDRSVDDMLPTQLHEQVVYDNWLRGEFGAPDAEPAEEHGKELLEAQAFTWDEIRNGDDADEELIDAKKDKFREVATELGPAAGYFTGEDGSRTGIGFLALLQSLCYALFQLFAKGAVLLAQILVRLFTLTAPLIGLVALLHHDILRRVGKVVGTVAFNLFVLSVLAGIHALLLRAIFSAGSALSMLTQMAVAGLVTILLFLVGKPGRRLWQMVEMSVGAAGSAIPSPRGGLFSRFRKSGRTSGPQEEFWRTVRDTDEIMDGSGSSSAAHERVRPEATVAAGAQRLDRPGAGAPSRVGGSGQTAQPALPGGGTPMNAFSGTEPSRNPADYLHRQRTSAATARRETTGGEGNRSGGIDTDPVVPSWVSATDDPAAGPSEVSASEPRSLSSNASRSAEPHRVEPELVEGKPVFVLYRPSQGLEVRNEVRDTDRVVR